MSRIFRPVNLLLLIFGCWCLVLPTRAEHPDLLSDSTPAAAPRVLYVKADATGTNTGGSWTNAYHDLQFALSSASEWGAEIWVAAGTYKPTTGTDRNISFVMEAGVALYGGFAGTETSRAQRNWTTNPTILSGDIGIPGDNKDNSYRVVIGADNAVLDGFTITRGNATGWGVLGRGGGMHNNGTSPAVSNCVFSGNTASDSGGGMYNVNSSLVVTYCTFDGNIGQDIGGGGMYNAGGSPTVSNCIFSGNAARDGGGMRNSGSSPTVTNCTFSNNTARGDASPTYGGYGGGMYNWYSSPTLTNCTFQGNDTGNYMYSGCGGGMYNSSSSPTITNCTFSGNKGGGGGMYNLNSAPTVTHSAFSGNMGQGIGGGGMCNWGSSSTTVINCTFTGNSARSRFDGSGGGLYNYGGSAIVTDCTFINNTAHGSIGYGGYGGAMYSGGGSTMAVNNCIFSGNTAHGYGGYSGWGGYGGGMFNAGSGSTSVTNCTFSGNAASSGNFGGYSGHGGGMFNSYSSLTMTMTNCTFTSNTASLTGGGMRNSGSSPTVTNCIFWDNTAPLGDEIYNTFGASAAFRHCNIRGSGGSGALWDTALGTDGGGNIMANPRFVNPENPAGPDGLWRTQDDGLRLQSDSPCIGAADPALAPERDILGLLRPVPPSIGAYEYGEVIPPPPPARANPAWQLFE